MSVSPPRPKGPPLNALRAFEAAGRMGGFARAAEELGVTPGAISQHISTLEGWTGTLLFERRSQGVRLTKTGADLLPQFSAAFDELGHAVRALRATTPQPTLHLALLPSIAQLWLAPRLPRLRAALPGLKLSVSAVETPPNLDRELFDLSLFIRKPSHCAGETVICPDVIFPVCSPEIAAHLTTPDQLSSQVLLHDATWFGDWALWADHTGCFLSNIASGPQFSLYSLALEEARNGAGVLMGHSCLVQDALDAGDLVQPFRQIVPTGKALVLETAQSAKLSSEAQVAMQILAEPCA